MSVRVNLLPHREARRKRQKQRFVTLCGLSFAASAAVSLLVHVTIAGMIDDQQSRNSMLKTENERLKKQNTEIDKLKEEIRLMIARKNVIEGLQNDRSQSVHLLDQLVRQTPDGVYLRSIKQEGLRVGVLGYAQSNARVSTFMRNIQGSGVLESPTLVEIKAAVIGNKRVSDFSLNLTIKKPKPEELAKAPPKPAAPAAAASQAQAPAAQPATQAPTPSAAQPAQPVAQPAAQPVAQPAAQPVAQPAAAPAQSASAPSQGGGVRLVSSGSDDEHRRQTSSQTSVKRRKR